MSQVQVYSCDGCGKAAPPKATMLDLRWYHGWFHVEAGGFSPGAVKDNFDACSLDCLAVTVARLRGDTGADELEALWAAPAADEPVKPKRAPAKRQPRKKPQL